jgi:amino acid adenylation domain-containing protein
VAVPSVAPDSLAYVMFTSGSTGAPKGVPISNRNAISYVRYIASTQDISEQDRFAQAVDLTFDLCIHPIFVCWEVGACLCSLPRESVMAPALFIRRERITVWVSVPSTGVFLLTMRLLKPGTFPDLRLSVFCGEPLSAKVAAAWQAACPNGRVENVYGPTEATVAITRYVWDEERSETECENGIVPIGWLFEGQMGLIVGDKLHPVEQGTPGELLLAGSQVTSGYLNQPALNADRFVHVPGSTERWYRTGDLVREDGNRCLHYVGRIDNQVKVRGFRVELQEIDHALRRAAGTEDAIALAWPIRNGSADGIIAFVAGPYPLTWCRAPFTSSIDCRSTATARSTGRHSLSGSLARTPEPPESTKECRMPLSESEIREAIIEIARASSREQLGADADQAEITGSTNLVGSGLFDSMGFMNLLVKVEDRFEVEVDLDDREPSEFTTVDGLARAVAQSADSDA